MNAVSETSVLSRMIRPLAGSLGRDLLKAIATMKPDDREQQRYEELADKHTEGLLTEAEKAELESIVRANSFLSAMKAEAMVRLGFK